jgi:arylsulfatase A
MAPYCYIENDRPAQLPTEYTPGGDSRTTGFWRPGPISPDFKHVEVLPNLTHRVVKYIDDHAPQSKENPFLIYFALTAPHCPIAPADFVKGASQAGGYGDFVVEVDWAVGEVLKALDRNGIANDTLIFFTSDNGSPARTKVDHSPYSMMRIYHHYPNANLRGIKADVWEGGHREPCFARWPRNIPAGTVSHETICLVDLMATCAAIVGEDLPSNAAEDSFNLLPLLRQQSSRPIRDVTVHQSGEGMYALRQGPWKMIFGVGNGGWDQYKYHAKMDDPYGQLYNIETDIGEKVNLYDQHPEMVKKFWEMLLEIEFQGHSRPMIRT